MAETYFYNNEEFDENTLVLRIQKGEDELFSLLTAAYLPIIDLFVSALNCAASDKEDFVQIGLLSLYGAVGAYDFSSATFKTFASLCIRRAISSELRRISSKKQIPRDAIVSIDDADVFDINDPESALICKESVNMLTDRIRLSLSAYEYKVLNAYLKLGNYGEVATLLKITVKDVNNALQRARKKIKKSVGCSR